MNLITGITKNTLRAISLKIGMQMFVVILLLEGCTNGSKKDDDDETSQSVVKGKIEVQVVTPHSGSISQYETLNATTAYLLNDAIRAPISGYVRKENITLGQAINEGDILFSIQGKEAAAMNIIKDTTLHINGTIPVKATETGIVKTIDRQLGDFVQEGDELCNIAIGSSLVFILEVPFEMHQYIKDGGTYTVTLPDGQKVETQVTSRIAEMDKEVQMERYVLKASSPLNLPAGLIANVKIPTNSQSNAIVLPKSAILCNETQSQFWVMKLVHDSLAVKIPIEKGAETKDSLQIKSPVFSTDDKILISGNYGLPDTALVKVLH